MAKKVPDEPSQAELQLNRANIAYAQLQRRIQSWMPARPEGAGAEESTGQQPEDEDGDDILLDELGGLGSKRKADDDDIFGSLKRNKVARDDKLLERLMGSKGAREMRKSQQEASKTGLHTASKPMSAASKRTKATDESGSEEEDGRAMAFKSKLQKTAPTARENSEQSDAEVEEAEVDAIADPALPTTNNAPQKTKKAMPTSYLDEMLAAKTKKKKKKKPKSAEATT
ncbi:hypothetical protein LTR62_001644 [Meristemomyces frigidus]|uniref:Uncharacterized protein n=1 Tax=Meristemomyces frigidus TaxID=1508187 RepID=A0AAN7T8W6_9PEZI|nr:hypothetical protein LTR62_001644 [Meristemomyces frigidus]